MNLDELTHELEVEAEILRALAHLSPRAACDFLLRLALKVNRECRVDSEPSSLVPPSPSSPEPIIYEPAPGPEQDRTVAPLPVAPNKTVRIWAYVRDHGPLPKKQAIREISEITGDKESNVAALMWKLLARRSRPRLDEDEETGIVTAVPREGASDGPDASWQRQYARPAQALTGRRERARPSPEAAEAARVGEDDEAPRHGAGEVGHVEGLADLGPQ